LKANATVHPMVNQVQYHVGMGADPGGMVRVFDRNSRTRPLSFTPLRLRLKLVYACDQWHSSWVVTPLTGWHCKFCPNTEGLISYCNKTGIVLEAYSPLAGGRLLKTNASFPMGAALASKYNWSSAAQVGLAWIAQRGLPVVTKSSNSAYLAEDLLLFGAEHTLSTSDRQSIDALARDPVLWTSTSANESI
jgi:diketogulonate reductase-like aldo/keto reductase